MRLRDFLRAARPVPRLPATAAPLDEPYAGLGEWQQALATSPARFDAQWALQGEIGAAVGRSGWPGWCGICSRPVCFDLPSSGSGARANLREEMACPGCRLTARTRAALSLLTRGLALESAGIYLTEQASAAFLWLQAVCPLARGSEYGMQPATRVRLQSWYSSLGGRGALVERDVTRLDFADASLDAIGSFDVLEHVPGYTAALREFARCLRAGGRLVLTAPFVESEAATLVRARVGAGGEVEHLCTPELHGDPVSGGVLCYYHFGWDLLDAARSAGFRQAHWVRTWSPREGLFSLWTLVATR